MAKKKATREAVACVKPTARLPALVAELQTLQRRRSALLKSRIMQENAIRAAVARELGYRTDMEEKEKRAAWDKAAALIKSIADGGEPDFPLRGMVEGAALGIASLNKTLGAWEKSMEKLAAQLPVAAWVKRPEQRGFGLFNLAVVVGECGDLSNYANPAKVWRRLGCAPHSFDGKTLMGATWKAGKEGKLPASEWESFGYSPRRRSIAYNVGEPLLKLNFVRGNGSGESAAEADMGCAGPYRARYVEAKVRAHQTHTEWDWKPCPDCEGKRCPKCGGTGETCLRAHRHGMLLMTKLLLKNLWIEWNGRPARVPVEPKDEVPGKAKRGGDAAAATDTPGAAPRKKRSSNKAA